MTTSATTMEAIPNNSPSQAVPSAQQSPAISVAENPVSAYPTDEEILGIDTLESGAESSAESSHASTATNANETESSARSESHGEVHSEVHGNAQQGRESTAAAESAPHIAIPKEFEQLFATPGPGPKLREIFTRESEYRAVFPTVAGARIAADAQRDLSRLDQLFDSADPAAHLELMSSLAQRDPSAFRALAATFGERLADFDPEAHRVISADFACQALHAAKLPEQLDLLARAADKGDSAAAKFLAAELAAKVAALASPAAAARPVGARHALPQASQASPPGAGSSSAFTSAARTPLAPAADSSAQRFMRDVNTEIENSVQQSISRRVADLLPDAPDATRTKISNEIYRDLDAALKKDSELLQQVSSALAAAQTSASFGEKQRAALATVVLNRAKSVLPAVTKRVINDWTAAVISTHQSRRAKQSAAASRADVGIGGAPRPISTAPSRIDYRNLSDEEILNS